MVKWEALALLMVLSCKALNLLELLVTLHPAVKRKHFVKLIALIGVIDTSTECAYHKSDTFTDYYK